MPGEIAGQILATWRRHNEILLYLPDATPREGLAAMPTGSRGRDVARQFAHLARVRTGWVHYHLTGRKPKLPRHDKGKRPTKAELDRLLRESGAGVDEFLERGLRGDVRPKLFGKQVVRWLGYLIAHESHHRGQILLALKQSGMRLPDEISVRGLWGRWIYGK